MAGDGNDVELVRCFAESATTYARNGQGPQFLELSTYRWREHCGPSFDHELNYRSSVDIKAGLADCPIERYKTVMNHNGVDINAVLTLLEKQLHMEIEDAFEFAVKSSNPLPATALEKLYA